MKKQRRDGKRGRVYPHTWITGPDPIRHEKYYAYLRHRAQAHFRGEPYDLTFDQWLAFWPNELWPLRGKSRECLCITMTDPELGWTESNCEIVTRLEQLQRQARGRIGTTYRKKS